MTGFNPLGFLKLRVTITTRHSGKIVAVLNTINVEKSGNEIDAIRWGKGGCHPAYLRLADIVAIEWRRIGFWGWF